MLQRMPERREQQASRPRDPPPSLWGALQSLLLHSG